MPAPAGAPARENVSAWAGTSGSVAVAVNVRVAPGTAAAAAGTVNTGAAFISRTVSVTGASVEVTPSDTRTVKPYSAGPWASAGVQVNAPVAGSMPAPAGAPTRLNVSDWVGRSGSVA